MQKPLLTIICLLACVQLMAQNWQPFKFGETHHYHSDTIVGYPDQSIEVDSITGTAADSVWHFNRFLTPLDLYNAVKNVPAFCQRKMRVQAGCWYQFFDPGNVVVHATASVGEIWLLDSLQGHTGQVDAIWADSVLGVPDSLKRILLSSGDTIILSQNHGLVQWPAVLGGHRFVLSGLQVQHLGELMPDFDALFDYHPGQIFCWWSQHKHYALQLTVENVRIKMEILSTVRDSTGLKVYFSGIKQPGTGLFPFWLAASAFALDSFYVVDAPGAFVQHQHREEADLGTWQPSLNFPGNWDYQFLAAGPGDIMALPVSSAPYETYSIAQRTAGGDTLRLGMGMDFRFPSSYQESGTDTLQFQNVLVLRFDIICKRGIGFENMFLTTPDDDMSYRLQGYTTAAGDTVGTIWQDPILAAGEQSQNLEVQLFPQPADAVIAYRLLSEMQATLEILSVQGQVLRQFELTSSSGEIDVRDLPAGMYLLRFTQDGAQATQRVMVAH